MTRWIVGAAGIAALLTLSVVAPGDSLLKKAAAEFRRAGADLDEIEEREGAEVAAGEIALARRWIDEGFSLLRTGEQRAAAVFAERLPIQLTLIRTVLAAREAEEKAEREEREATDSRDKLKLLRARYDRLVLKYRGAEATDAYPRKKGN
ncbi:MAG: hypothetical protein JRF63_11695 [Deltaproteobacteria bacterium]|nr:hypothetical protein [Deltaproteobacteria bacterium]